jgi:hypothetical protein
MLSTLLLVLLQLRLLLLLLLLLLLSQAICQAERALCHCAAAPADDEQPPVNVSRCHS